MKATLGFEATLLESVHCEIILIHALSLRTIPWCLDTRLLSYDTHIIMLYLYFNSLYFKSTLVVTVVTVLELVHC